MRHHPVPRDCDPPGTADYLGTPDEDDDMDEDGDGVPGRDRERERLGLLAGLREVFPQWAISYSPFSRAWIARKDGATICQGSAALLCIALLLIDGRNARPGAAPAGTGPRGPVASPLMPHPVTIQCARCGQVFTCDVSSDAARDRTCGPCAVDPGTPETDDQ